MTKDNKQTKLAFIFFDIGWRIAIPLVLFVIIGNSIDKRFHTTPLFILSGICLSLATTTWGIYTTIKKLNKDQQ
jgi:hypothetical protein